MLDDILDFAASVLIDGGRLSMWMPTANDEDIEIAIPQHHCLKLVAVCVQEFNKCKSMASYGQSNLWLISIRGPKTANIYTYP